MQITAVKVILKKKNKSLTSSVTPIFQDVGIPLLQSI